MKTITLTVDVVCEIEDDVNPNDVYLVISSCYPHNGNRFVGRSIRHDTTGFFEEEKLGLSEFGDKPETD